MNLFLNIITVPQIQPTSELPANRSQSILFIYSYYLKYRIIPAFINISRSFGQNKKSTVKTVLLNL